MGALSAKLRNAEDDGLLFVCPGCDMVHQIKTGAGSRPRWTWNGDVDRPTFSPSVLVTFTIHGKPHVCHTFVRDGSIEFLADCTHALAGKTVELPDFPHREWE
jgi:hypothetical protein